MSYDKHSVFIGMALLASLAVAQNPSGSRYDPATGTTVTGTVSEVTEQARGRMRGLHLNLTADAGMMNILVGPKQFVDSKQFTIAKGDRIEVTGSRFEVGGVSTIIAREINKGDQTLTLRDKNGVPAWSQGRGRRRRAD
jgi:DNA/RNA endonuclease YhcR with UshA esterase domain